MFWAGNWGTYLIKLKSDMSRRWAQAQEVELDCWIASKDTIQSPVYLRAKKDLWLGVLALLRDYVSFADLTTKRVLEFGCGPNGVFLLVDNNPQYLCLDPLMDQYRAHFPFINRSGVTFINSKIEDYQSGEDFDLVLGFNALDHVDDIYLSVQKISQLLAGDGLAVISVNAHKFSLFRSVLSWAYPLLDKPHKHQYTADQYRVLFNNVGLEVMEKFSLDKVLSEFVRELGESAPGPASWWSPAGFFFNLLGLLGIKHYGYQSPGDRSVYSCVCFVLKKKSRA